MPGGSAVPEDVSLFGCSSFIVCTYIRIKAVSVKVPLLKPNRGGSRCFLGGAERIEVNVLLLADRGRCGRVLGAQGWSPWWGLGAEAP